VVNLPLGGRDSDDRGCGLWLLFLSVSCHLSLALRPVEKRCEAEGRLAAESACPLGSSWRSTSVQLCHHCRPCTPCQMPCRVSYGRCVLRWLGGRGEIRGGLEGHLYLLIFYVYACIARLFAKACIAFCVVPYFPLCDLACRSLVFGVVNLQHGHVVKFFHSTTLFDEPADFQTFVLKQNSSYQHTTKLRIRPPRCKSR